MRHLPLTLAIALAAGGLAACTPTLYSGGQRPHADHTEAPLATNFRAARQPKLQAAQHWGYVARHAADALAKGLKEGGACLPKTGCATLFVKRACETGGCETRPCDTTFNQVFHEELVTALVARGYPVATEPRPDALVVEADVRAVRFAPDRPQYRYAGAPAEIGPGIWALSDVTTLIDKAGAEAVRTRDPDANWYRTEFAGGPTPQNELVVTVSAIGPDKTYLARNTTAYYTADRDAMHYFCAPPNASPRGRLYSVPVTGDCSAGRCLETVRGRP